MPGTMLHAFKNHTHQGIDGGRERGRERFPQLQLMKLSDKDSERLNKSLQVTYLFKG